MPCCISASCYVPSWPCHAVCGVPADLLLSQLVQPAWQLWVLVQGVAFQHALQSLCAALGLAVCRVVHLHVNLCVQQGQAFGESTRHL